MADKPLSDPGKTEQLSNWENEGGALEGLHEELDGKGKMEDAIRASRSGKKSVAVHSHEPK